LDAREELRRALSDAGFEIADTCFEAITLRPETARLRELPALPDCESSRLLINFPDYFVVHRRAKPDHGVLFMSLARHAEGLSDAASGVLDTYFPESVAVVSQAADGQLLAKWHGTDEEPEPLAEFLRAVTEA